MSTEDTNTGTPGDPSASRQATGAGGAIPPVTPVPPPLSAYLGGGETHAAGGRGTSLQVQLLASNNSQRRVLLVEAEATCVFIHVKAIVSIIKGVNVKVCQYKVRLSRNAIPIISWAEMPILLNRDIAISIVPWIFGRIFRFTLKSSIFPSHYPFQWYVHICEQMG